MAAKALALPVSPQIFSDHNARAHFTPARSPGFDVIRVFTGTSSLLLNMQRMSCYELSGPSQWRGPCIYLVINQSKGAYSVKVVNRTWICWFCCIWWCGKSRIVRGERGGFIWLHRSDWFTCHQSVPSDRKDICGFTRPVDRLQDCWEHVDVDHQISLAEHLIFSSSLVSNLRLCFSNLLSQSGSRIVLSFVVRTWCALQRGLPLDPHSSEFLRQDCFRFLESLWTN